MGYKLLMIAMEHFIKETRGSICILSENKNSIYIEIVHLSFETSLLHQ